MKRTGVSETGDIEVDLIANELHIALFVEELNFLFLFSYVGEVEHVDLVNCWLLVQLLGNALVNAEVAVGGLSIIAEVLRVQGQEQRVGRGGIVVTDEVGAVETFDGGVVGHVSVAKSLKSW